MLLLDESRFFRPYFVKSLAKSNHNNCIILDKNGVGELSNIQNNDSFRKNGQRFLIPLQLNTSIRSLDCTDDGNTLLTSDRNGFLHCTNLKSNKSTSNLKTELNLLTQSTKHIEINDLAFKSDEDTEFKSTFDFNETKRDFKIRPYHFLNQTSSANVINTYQNTLKEITFSKGYNYS